ncbi:hypothetical protein Golob_000648 [Gossypium lobatum]|uniref:Uncharacterized protein n=1 Tax=Gossypium lobatum TaxID=34289 RepID=A0A7J8N947_9ROSI|nr:hypothetical protein [Gossypium lobatum]
MEFTVRANFSCSNSGVSRATKKVRTRSDLSLESKDLTVDGNEKNIQGSELPKASHKSMLMGASSNPSQNVFMEEDFPFIDDDVTEVIEGVPSITFSDRVQKYIERRMAKTIIVKLLGKKIGFNALLNKRLQKGKGCFSGAARKDDFNGGYYGSRFTTLKGDEAKIHRMINGKKDGATSRGDKGESFEVINKGKLLNIWKIR